MSSYKKFGLLFAILISFITGFLFWLGTFGVIVSFSFVLLMFGLFYVDRINGALIVKLMLVAVLFVPFNYFSFLNILNFINPLTVLGIIGGVKLILNKNILRISVIDKIYFLFLLSAMFSTCFAKSTLGAVNWIFYSFFTGYIGFKLVSSLKKEELFGIIRFLVYAGCLCVLYGILELLCDYSVIFGKGMSRLTSLLGHPLMNGLMLAVILPFSLGSFIESRRKVFLFTSAVIFLGVLLTYSRGSWFALLCGFFVLILLASFKMKLRLILLVGLLATIFLSISPIRNAVIDRLNTREGSSRSSFNIRVRSIPIAIKSVSKNPMFGGGPFNSTRYKDELATDYVLRRTSFENSYLSFLVDLGFIGLFLLLSMFLVVFKRILFIKSVSKDFAIYRLVAITSLVVLMINMSTFSFDSHRAFHFVMFFYMGLAIAIHNLIAKENLNISIHSK